ncbi:MAG: hypothetical protein AAFS10_05550, partial [Myxococcota bacterium]
MQNGSRVGVLCTAFLAMLGFLFLKVIILIQLQRSALALTGDPMAVTSDTMFWVVLALCLLPILGVSALLFWLASEHMDNDRLSPTEKLLLREGRLVLGTVRGQHRHELEIGYLDPEGVRRTLILEAYNHADLERYPVGSELTLLLDPQSPTDCLSPALLGAEFESSQTIDDHRPSDLLGLKLPERPTLASAQTFPLVSTLHPLSAPWTLVIQRLLAFRRRASLQIGTLAFADGRFVQELERDGTRCVVDLNQPFAADISIWVLSNTEATVHVTLRQRGAQPTDRSLVLQTELPQAMLGAELPVLQSAGPYIDPETFLKLWHQVRYYANGHGEEV